MMMLYLLQREEIELRKFEIGRISCVYYIEIEHTPSHKFAVPQSTTSKRMIKHNQQDVSTPSLPA